MQDTGFEKLWFQMLVFSRWCSGPFIIFWSAFRKNEVVPWVIYSSYVGLWSKTEGRWGQTECSGCPVENQRDQGKSGQEQRGSARSDQADQRLFDP